MSISRKCQVSALNTIFYGLFIDKIKKELQGILNVWKQIV